MRVVPRVVAAVDVGAGRGSRKRRLHEVARGDGLLAVPFFLWVDAGVPHGVDLRQ